MSSNGNKAEKTDYFDYLVESINRLQDAKNFNRVAKALIPITATADSVTCELTVDEEHVNGKGTLHGGQTVSLVDILTARAVGMSTRDMPMVSVELSTSFLLPAPVGEVLIIYATVLKKGRSMAFTECEFRRKSDNKLIAKGKHTLALLPYLKEQNPSVNQF